MTVLEIMRITERGNGNGEDDQSKETKENKFRDVRGLTRGRADIKDKENILNGG